MGSLANDMIQPLASSEEECNNYDEGECARDGPIEDNTILFCIISFDGLVQLFEDVRHDTLS